MAVNEKTSDFLHGGIAADVRRLCIVVVQYHVPVIMRQSYK
jgi:hypothetical protein